MRRGLEKAGIHCVEEERDAGTVVDCFVDEPLSKVGIIISNLSVRWANLLLDEVAAQLLGSEDLQQKHQGEDCLAAFQEVVGLAHLACDRRLVSVVGHLHALKL